MCDTHSHTYCHEMQDEKGDWPADGVRTLPDFAQQMTERYADSLEADCRKDAAALFQLLWRSVPVARQLSPPPYRVWCRGRGEGGADGVWKKKGLYLEGRRSVFSRGGPYLKATNVACGDVAASGCDLLLPCTRPKKKQNCITSRKCSTISNISLISVR